MLERLRIQNFKSWQDTGDMAFGSLTGFFGTNSSGKSSILQFLLMLKQTVESSDRSRVLHLGDDKSYVDLGTMYDILFMHEDPGTLSFDIQWKYAVQTLGGNFIDHNASFSASVDYNSDRMNLRRFKYDLESQMSPQFKQVNWIASMRQVNDNSSSGYRLDIRDSGDFIHPTKILSQRPSKFYIFPNEAHASYEDYYIMEDSVFTFEDFFATFYYLGPLREYPERLYIWGGERLEDVGTAGGGAVAAMLSSRQQGPTIDMGEGNLKRTVEEHVAHWLKELGLIYSFKVQPIAPNRKEYEVRIQRTAESASVFLTDVGFGVSQILPVLVLLFYVPEGSTVILEQPEIHLHPAVQAGLADVFIDAIKRRKLQIILESHSEHLLQRLQRRMAEEVIAPEAVKLYFTSIEEGKSKLTPLELDEYGNIHNWPAGFFGDAFAEAAAKMKAEMKRKMQNQ